MPVLSALHLTSDEWIDPLELTVRAVQVEVFPFELAPIVVRLALWFVEQPPKPKDLYWLRHSVVVVEPLFGAAVLR